MINTTKVKDSAAALLAKSNEIFDNGVKAIFIAENQEARSHGAYIDPHHIIIDIEQLPLAKEKLENFARYCRETLEHQGITVLSKKILEEGLSDVSFSGYSKHLLDSAIPISEVDTSISWQQQFENKLQGKRPREEERGTDESWSSRVKRSSSPAAAVGSGRSSSPDSDDSAATQFLSETIEVREKMKQLHPSAQAKVLQMIGKDCGFKVTVEKDQNLGQKR